MSDGGKGSAPRPFSVDNETFKRNFDAIFGKTNEQLNKDSISTDSTLAEIRANPSEEKKAVSVSEKTSAAKIDS